MNTKSKRHLDRSKSAGRVPRHYSHIIEDTPAVSIGLWIVGAILVFLVLIALSAFVG